MDEDFDFGKIGTELDVELAFIAIEAISESIPKILHLRIPEQYHAEAIAKIKEFLDTKTAELKTCTCKHCAERKVLFDNLYEQMQGNTNVIPFRKKN